MASQTPTEQDVSRARVSSPASKPTRILKATFVALQPGNQQSRRQYAEKAFPYVKQGRAFFMPRPRNTGVLFVSGVQRSGTTLLLRMLDRSWLTEVFHEHRPVAYEQYSLRELDILRKLVVESSAPVVVFKALIDSFRLSDLLNQFDGSKAIWAFRQYDDVVNSHLRKWPTGRNRIDKVVVDPLLGQWRGERMSDETHRILRSLYKKGMSNASAQALFWYYRNQLFFDQGLDRNSNVILLNYDALIVDPAAESERLATFLNLPINMRMTSIVSSEAAGRHGKADLPPDIRDACDGMYKSLLSCWERQRATGT